MVLVPPRWMGRLALGLLALDLAIALPANAQDYPSQTLKIVVPFVAATLDRAAAVAGKISQ